MPLEQGFPETVNPDNPVLGDAWGSEFRVEPVYPFVLATTEVEGVPPLVGRMPHCRCNQ